MLQLEQHRFTRVQRCKPLQVSCLTGPAARHWAARDFLLAVMTLQRDNSVSSHARNFSGPMTNLRCSSWTRNGSIGALLSSQTVSGFSRDSGKVYLIRGSYDSPDYLATAKRPPARYPEEGMSATDRSPCNGGRIASALRIMESSA